MLLIFIIQSFLKTRYLCCYIEVSFSNYSCKYWKYTQLVVQTFDSSFVECNSFDFFDASVPILIIITLNTSKWQTRLLLSAKLSPDTMRLLQGLLLTSQRPLLPRLASLGPTLMSTLQSAPCQPSAHRQTPGYLFLTLNTNGRKRLTVFVFT